MIRREKQAHAKQGASLFLFVADCDPMSDAVGENEARLYIWLHLRSALFGVKRQKHWLVLQN